MFPWTFSVVMNQHFWQKAVFDGKFLSSSTHKAVCLDSLSVCPVILLNLFTQSLLRQNCHWQARILRFYIVSQAQAPSEAVLPGTLPSAAVPRLLKGIHSMERKACQLLHASGLSLQLQAVFTCVTFHREVGSRLRRSPDQRMMRVACQVLRSDFITVLGQRGEDGVLLTSRLGFENSKTGYCKYVIRAWFSKVCRYLKTQLRAW